MTHSELGQHNCTQYSQDHISVHGPIYDLFKANEQLRNYKTTLLEMNLNWASELVKISNLPKSCQPLKTPSMSRSKKKCLQCSYKVCKRKITAARKLEQYYSPALVINL